MNAIASGKILTFADGPLRILALNRPNKLNALDEEMLLAIENQIDAWEHEASVVLIESTSPKAFCVGADIERLSTFTADTMRGWELLGCRVLDRLQQTPLITIASIPRFALGGGLTLALACDFRIAENDATFAQPEIGLGWVPGWGGVLRLARAVGPVKAKLLSITGRRINAAEALGIGLIDQLAPAAGLNAAARELASSIANQSAQAVRYIKRTADNPPAAAPEAWQADADMNAALLTDPRGQAEIQKFLEKKREKQVIAG